MSLKHLYVTLIITLLFSCKQENKPSDFDKFTGRWALYLVESQGDSNSLWIPRQDHYKNRKGFILYDGKGGMGVHHVMEGYDQYIFEGSGGLDNLTVNDLRHLADNFVYFGKYKVNDSLKIIEHHIESANFQKMTGTVAKRNYLFSGDTLILNPMTNKYPKTRLKWIKLNDQE
ncbi:Lipocalin-like domain-containing protein [Zhouia amylolytica]|uniref:Lipocalin-like domain-containing protein n=1 Tax=Zhouia amylolytica TaxID=376730 RepID=A0A1I6TW15_9FLAO|nr:lipocalin-like domain-containing protein [Zhouia amylolytica]SFS93423.1 Lipocalin-like domain-containing protein [Zhouia amylolytica]